MPCFLHFCKFFVGDIIVQVAPKHSAEVLSNVPMQEGCYVPHEESMCVLYKLHSDLSYNAIGCNFSVSESTIYIKQDVFKTRDTHKTGSY